MSGEFNYRKLQRSSILKLFPILAVGAALAVMLIGAPWFGYQYLSSYGFWSFAWIDIIQEYGTFVTYGTLFACASGIIGGVTGIYAAKRIVLAHFGGEQWPQDHPLVQAAGRMAQRLGMPAPAIVVYPDSEVNAWATGASPKDAVIGISRGALDSLSKAQVDAILAHELGHIAAGDLWRMQFAIGFQNAVHWLALHRGLRWLSRHSLGFVSELGVTGLSRRREYWADAVGAMLTSPEHMKSALLSVHNSTHLPNARRKQFSQLMLRSKGGPLLATHPTLDQRISALDHGAYLRAVRRKAVRSSYRSRHSVEGSSTVDILRVEWPSAVALACIASIFALAQWANVQLISTETPVAQQMEARGPRVAAWSYEEPTLIPGLEKLHPCLHSISFTMAFSGLKAQCTPYSAGSTDYSCTFERPKSVHLPAIHEVREKIESCFDRNGAGPAELMDFGDGPASTRLAVINGRAVILSIREPETTVQAEQSLTVHQTDRVD